MRFAYLTGYERKLQSEACTERWLYGYDAFESEDTLEAICQIYHARKSQKAGIYFRWFSLAVEQRNQAHQTV